MKRDVELKKAISERYGVPQDWITLGNGSNDIIDLAGRTFVQPGQSIVFSEYSFLVYALVAKATGANGIQVPSVDFGHDLPAMLAAIRPDTKLVSLPIRTILPVRFFGRRQSRLFSTRCRPMSWS